MRLGKFHRVVLIVFDVVLLATLLAHIIARFVLLNRPVFWIGAVVEIGIGWLAYRFWMRSLLVKGFKIDRILALVMIALGFSLPYIYFIPGLSFLNQAASADLFFYFTIVSMIIYSSFIIDKYLATHQPPGRRSGTR